MGALAFGQIPWGKHKQGQNAWTESSGTNPDGSAYHGGAMGNNMHI